MNKIIIDTMINRENIEIARWFALAGFILGSGTIVAAWGFEVLGGYVPCELCLLERIPYYLALPFGLLAIIALLQNNLLKVAGVSLLLSGLIMLVSTGLGVHHVGIEWQWWRGLAGSCTSSMTAIPDDVGDIGAFLRGEKPISFCGFATWHFLGLSFAGWNSVISALIAAFSFGGYYLINRKAAD